MIAYFHNVIIKPCASTNCPLFLYLSLFLSLMEPHFMKYIVVGDRAFHGKQFAQADSWPTELNGRCAAHFYPDSTHEHDIVGSEFRNLAHGMLYLARPCGKWANGRKTTMQTNGERRRNVLPYCRLSSQLCASQLTYCPSRRLS